MHSLSLIASLFILLIYNWATRRRVLVWSTSLEIDTQFHPKCRSFSCLIIRPICHCPHECAKCNTHTAFVLKEERILYYKKSDTFCSKNDDDYLELKDVETQITKCSYLSQVVSLGTTSTALHNLISHQQTQLIVSLSNCFCTRPQLSVEVDDSFLQHSHKYQQNSPFLLSSQQHEKGSSSSSPFVEWHIMNGRHLLSHQRQWQHRVEQSMICSEYPCANTAHQRQTCLWQSWRLHRLHHHWDRKLCRLSTLPPKKILCMMKNT